MKEEKDYLRVMKHDIKGPLTVVKGYLSFWESDAYTKFPPEKQKDFILKALGGAKKMEELVDSSFATLQNLQQQGELRTPDDNSGKK